jgi:hypothetical protein
MRFIIFVLITYALFQGAHALLGEQRDFFQDNVFYVVFVPDRENEDIAPIIIDFDNLGEYVAKNPNHGFIPASSNGIIIDNRDGEYHRAEYEIDEINADYLQAVVTYYVKNNKTFSSYLIENGEIRPLSKSTPRNKLVIAYAVIFIFLSLSLTVIVIYFLEPRYKKYLNVMDKKFDLYVTGNRQIRFFIRGVMFFYLLPVLYFLYEITNNLQNITDLVLVGIVVTLSVNLLIATIFLDKRVIKSLFILVTMILLFPGRIII